MAEKRVHTPEEVARVCAEIRRKAELENAWWQLKVGYGGLLLFVVLLVVTLWAGEWSWWFLTYSLMPVVLIINGHRILQAGNRGKTKECPPGHSFFMLFAPVPRCGC